MPLSMINVFMMYIPMIHVSMVLVSKMHVYVMHVSIMWCMCVRCGWHFVTDKAILGGGCMMHAQCIYDPGPWSWFMHVGMMHVSMMRLKFCHGRPNKAILGVGWLHSPSPVSWAKEKAGSRGLPCFDASSIEKVRGDKGRPDAVRKKNGIMWGKFPNWGGGVWPKPTPYFSLFCPIQGLMKWQKKKWKFPNWGDGEGVRRLGIFPT